MYMPWSKGSAAAIFGALLPDLSCLIFESFSGFFVRTGSLLHLSLSFRVAKSVDRVTIHSLRTLSTWLRFLSDSKIQRSCENEKKTGKLFSQFSPLSYQHCKKLPSTLRTLYRSAFSLLRPGNCSANFRVPLDNRRLFFDGFDALSLKWRISYPHIAARKVIIWSIVCHNTSWRLNKRKSSATFSAFCSFASENVTLYHRWTIPLVIFVMGLQSCRPIDAKIGLSAPLMGR